MGKETADQKLIKIIENSGTPESGSSEAKKISDAVKGSGVSGSKFSFPFSSKTKKVNSKNRFGLKELNKLLIVLIVLVTILFLVDLIDGSRRMQKSLDLSIESALGKRFSTPVGAPKNLLNYLSSVETRNIFQPFEKKQQEAIVEETPEAALRISLMTQKLKLVGISWLDSAETASVMIEDTETGVTYFSKQGGKVKDLTVKTIYTDRIILTYEDEEVVIKL